MHNKTLLIFFTLLFSRSQAETLPNANAVVFINLDKILHFQENITPECFRYAHLTNLQRDYNNYCEKFSQHKMAIEMRGYAAIESREASRNPQLLVDINTEVNEAIKIYTKTCEPFIAKIKQLEEHVFNTAETIAKQLGAKAIIKLTSAIILDHSLDITFKVLEKLNQEQLP